MLRHLAISLLAAATLASPLMGQIRGTMQAPPRGAPVPPMRSGFTRTVIVGPPRFHHQRPFGRQGFLWPYPYFDSGFDYEPAVAEPAQPPAVVVQAAPQAPAPPVSAPEPLLIEWQGDHFVRMSLSEKVSSSGQGAADYSERFSQRSASGAQKGGVEPPRELPPAVLVFRDGRQEEVSNYTIMSGTIYTKSDFWTTGSWSKKVQLADLDIPATLKLNQQRGANFNLPSNPNEVMVRP
jgi:hypothetical protein